MNWFAWFVCSLLLVDASASAQVYSVKSLTMSEEARRIDAALDEVVSVDCEAEPLSEVLWSLCDQIDVECVVDEPALAAEATDITTIEVSLTLRDRAARAVLSHVLRPHKLVAVVENDLLLLTTKLDAEGGRHHRPVVYELDRIADALPPSSVNSTGRSDARYPAVWDLIYQGTSGYANWGRGVTTFRLHGDLLVVRAPPRVHHEIEDLFRQIESVRR